MATDAIQVVESCGCVGCDLELPVVAGYHGAGGLVFPCKKALTDKIKEK